MNEAYIRFLIEGISADVVRYLVERDGYTLKNALMVFHNSKIFDFLHDAETGLYIQSPAYIYTLLKEEIT